MNPYIRAAAKYPHVRAQALERRDARPTASNKAERPDPPRPQP